MGYFNSAYKLKKPVIIGLSEGERKFVGSRQAVALVKSLREEFNFPIFINADHCRSFESFKEAVDAGFDSAIFDGAVLALDENIKKTKQCIEYAKKINPEILIEGELGYIGASSSILNEMPEGVELTSVEDALKFVEETKVDLLAPAVGNIHGMLKGSKNPELNIQRIKEIKKAVKIPLVLHGGSGISDNDFSLAIKSGFSIVHINTEIRKAYREAIEKSLVENPNEITPYKLNKSVVDFISETVEKRIQLFSQN